MYCTFKSQTGGINQMINPAELDAFSGAIYACGNLHNGFDTTQKLYCKSEQ